MNEHLWIVICRSSNKQPWIPEARGVFDCRRLAENLVECRKAAGDTFEYAIVEGPITTPAAMAEAEARLGAF